jgi:UDP-N-acetylmuramoyl-L-alanyl-D-glutamate--2,6-diaminopimelate ligase
VSTQELASVRGSIRLEEILPDSKIIGKRDIRVRSCSSRWDECQPEDLYVAIVDSETDGHEFAREAVQRGAMAVVTERLLAIDRPQCIVEDTRLAFGTICHALAGDPSNRMATVGVSGSDGKTVTSHLIGSIFEASGGEVGVLTSIENRLGPGLRMAPNKQLNSALLADQLSAMVLSGCTQAVIEMPGIALAQHALSGISLDAAVLTNIRMDDIRFHGSKENYRRANTRLLDYLKPTGFAVLNADDPTTHFLLDQIDSPVLTIGMKHEAEVTARVVERLPHEQTFLISAGGESAVVRTSIIGDQHIYNCLSAAAVGLTSGIQLAVIAKGLEAAGNIPGRLERIECGQPFGVWVDSARSPRQLATAIQSVKRVTGGKIWCVCSISEHQSRADRRKIGEIIEKVSDTPVITNAEVNKNTDYEPTHQVLDGFVNPAKAQLIPNRFNAIEWTLSQAQPNDAVLITGCGDRPVARVGDHQWEISDRDICQAWLYDRGSWGQPSAHPRIFNIDDYR